MKSFVLRNVPAALAAIVVLLVGGAFAFAHSRDSKPEKSFGHSSSHHGGGHDRGHGDGHHGDHNPRGRRGPQGPPGPEGPPGPPAPTGLTTWGKMPRNEYGSPIAETGTTATGVNALIIQTGCFKEPCTDPASWEKAEYGSEVEFFGQRVADISEIGLSVYIADSTAGNSPMPNIQMEVNPKVAETYSSLVYNPPETAPNVFEYVDATTVPVNPGNEGWWFLRPGVAGATGCSQAHMCSLTEVQEAAPDAEIYTLGLGKGRDSLGEILISEFKLNGTTYTFGPGGTFKE